MHADGGPQPAAKPVDEQSAGERTGISSLLSALSHCGLRVKDISTEQSSLEDIFVELVGEGK